MKFTVELTDEAIEDFRGLDKVSQKKISKAFEWIEAVDIAFVNTKHLEDDLYEIKTDNIRALYGYYQDKTIIVTLIFLKKTQKTPSRVKERAKNILRRELK